MIERILVVIVLGLVGFGLYQLSTRHQLRKAARSGPVDPLLGDFKPGVPTIVYFTTPTCAPCRLQQTPTLQQLQAEVGPDSLRVIRVDATIDPQAAERWGVFSVPTTFVLDRDGKPRTVYNGVVDSKTLKQQLQV